MKSAYSYKKHIAQYIIIGILFLLIVVLCISVGSVNITFSNTISVLLKTIFGVDTSAPDNVVTIIQKVRLPRVLTAALVGGALSVCGVAMQGLLKNPLADGSTLGVSAGASLGAVIAIAFGANFVAIGSLGIVFCSILFSFLSLVIILTLSYKLDAGLSTNTIILIGVIFSMFTGSVTSLITSFAGDKVKNIVFWTMGSFAGSSLKDVLLIFIALFIGGAILIRYSNEINAFSLGEENARYIGVNVKKVKLIIMVSVSVLIGVSVAVSGVIGFVGLVIPHITRMIMGANHKRLLPFSIVIGAAFLMLCDLASRILIRPTELPVGIITSFVGSGLFIYIFYKSSRSGAGSKK